MALTVAGSDSGGGAGVQADLKTMEALGVFGTSALTSVTAQNTQGVDAIEDVSTDVVAAQIGSVAGDFDVGAAKTGMLSSAAIIETVADRLAGYDFPLVVDPVMVAQSGDRLLAEDAERTLREELLPKATLVTPNLAEAEVLTGTDVTDEAEMRSVAERIAERGPEAVLVTGGHLRGDKLVDVLYAAGETKTFRKRRVDTPNTHGSGCTLSAAVAAGLAGGADLQTAVERAEALLDRAVRYGLDVGEGAGPVHHMAGLRNDAARADALGEVREVLRALRDRDAGVLVPEVGLNVAVTTPYAVDTGEVAAVEGRVHRTADGLVPAGPPWLGASSHVARLLLAARHYDPSIAAAANVRLDDAVAGVVDERLDAVAVDRTAEPDTDPTEEREGGTMAWTVERAMADRETVPDAIYDHGAVGKEAMCRLFAESPVELQERLLRIDDGLGDES
ncbi:bifunctional hydroxymethylpyrimidine kinase/phosphomethylpyrimidine kinase [Halobacterium sp. KA-4]|uniref:bifunctional hydroxymethylpyrimidine kinase/phosphomethylpyrimidine kinase n=1 Tax=Halobacterium sp. KA-4 TaxID=2896367 RepID=UPI001E4B2AD7|nr:bifunctional hydroxymethylpyrimidine kinase/phosphomethylpyrimidine kinase [Halobacterium sp. KA-4]MCD2201082.1 bifunctional hydroxymethylpyrimidine kinase/phosphomethylpyrimidine kinase [Halobacterium sp. KA-4]